MDGTTTRKFSRREFAALILGAVAAGSSGHAVAAVNPAEGYVGKIADEVMSLANSGAKARRCADRFAAVLNRYINLRNIANFALGPYQKKLPPGRKKSNSTPCSTIMRRRCLSIMWMISKAPTWKLFPLPSRDNRITIVSAIIQNGGGREQVKWRLVPAGGGYKISDINVKGVWLTIATKKRFNDVLNRSKGDFGALFAELREAETW